MCIRDRTFSILVIWLFAGTDHKRDDDEEAARHHDIYDVVLRFAVEIQNELKSCVFDVRLQRVRDVVLLHFRRNQMPNIYMNTTQSLTA